jgi:SIR2-like domain
MTARELPEFIYYGNWRKKPSPHDLHTVSCTSVDAILSEFRKRCAEHSTSKDFARLKTFIKALEAEFEIAVVSVNYDNLIYRSLPGIETGFDPSAGRFEQERLYSRKEWPCMLHLHGSVHFDMQVQDINLHEVCWQSDLNGTFQPNSFGRSTDFNPEGADFPTSAIIAGYGKSTQLLRRPFRTYYSELDRLVAGCDAVLFAGYGFGDKHLNMAFERFRDARRRPVVIIGWKEDGSMTLSGSGWSSYDPRASTIFQTFNTDYFSMRWLGHSTLGRIDQIKLLKEFEYSDNPNTPLAFWYNGMLCACDYPEKILSRLKLN